MKKIIAVSLIIGLSGCAMHWTDIDIKPDGANAVSGHSNYKPASRCLAVMSDLKVKSNGQEVNSSAEFQNRFITHIRETKIFDSVVHDMPTTKPDKYVEFVLEAEENSDNHHVANVAKSFFIGLSLFTLTPALPFSYDFESVMHLYATRSDGKTKQYNARGKGSANYYVTLNNANLASQELITEVSNNNMNALINQLSLDENFLCSLNSQSIQVVEPPASIDSKEKQELPKKTTSVNLDESKAQCNELGFKTGTTDYGNCVLKLHEMK